MEKSSSCEGARLTKQGRKELGVERTPCKRNQGVNGRNGAVSVKKNGTAKKIAFASIPDMAEIHI